MGKFKGPRNKVQRDSFFKTNSNRNGKDFLDKMNSRVMEREVVKLFRDMANGNIDFYTEAEFFNHNQLINTCINVSFAEYWKHKMHHDGTYYLLQQGSSTGYDMNMLKNLNNKDRFAYEAYALINNAFLLFNSTRDITHLITLSGNLNRYRGNI